MRPADPPLTPSPDEGRSWLRRELLHAEYHQENLVQRFVTWLQRQVDRGLAAAADAPPLTTLATMVVFLLLLAGLAWLVSRARRTVRTRERLAGVLPAEAVSADDLRARAERALAEGRYGAAVLDGYRALAVRQVERGRLDDAPGATAQEVAVSLGASYPEQRSEFQAAALLFDRVRYGHRSASAEQARTVLALDGDLAARR